MSLASPTRLRCAVQIGGKTHRERSCRAEFERIKWVKKRVHVVYLCLHYNPIFNPNPMTYKITKKYMKQFMSSGKILLRSCWNEQSFIMNHDLQCTTQIRLSSSPPFHLFLVDPKRSRNGQKWDT